MHSLDVLAQLPLILADLVGVGQCLLGFVSGHVVVLDSPLLHWSWNS